MVLLRLSSGGALASLVLSVHSSVLAARASVPALLERAISDTNTVNTISYTVTQRQVSSALSYTIVDRGREDERHNAESHHVVSTINAVLPNGQRKHIHYTLDVTFSNQRTYFRSTVYKHNAWQEKPGSKLYDPILPQLLGWQRGRTTVKLPANARFTQVSGTNPTRFDAALKVPTGNVRDDLYVSGGSRPYVVRWLKTQAGVIQGKRYRQTVDVRFTAFNTVVTINVPSIGV